MSNLPKFNAGARCPKCGAGEISVRHMPGLGFPEVRSFYDCPQRNGNEHMHRACSRCRYEWDEAPLDRDAGGIGEGAL